MKRFLFAMACAALLGGCGEREQVKTADDAQARDAAPWKGAASRYAIPGWQTGDARAWENQLRRRGQNQNEFVKTN